MLFWVENFTTILVFPRKKTTKLQASSRRIAEVYFCFLLECMQTTHNPRRDYRGGETKNHYTKMLHRDRVAAPASWFLAGDEDF